MKQISVNQISNQTLPIKFGYTNPDTNKDIKVTIYLPFSVAFDEKTKANSHYLESIADAIANADMNGVEFDQTSFNEDWEYTIEHRGYKKTTFLNKLKEIGKNTPLEEKGDIKYFLDALPREYKLDTRFPIQVLNDIKKNYHPKNGYLKPNLIDNLQDENLYAIASVCFDLFGDYRYKSKWYVVRDMFSGHSVTKVDGKRALLVKSNDFSARLCFVSNKINRIAVFDDERYFNSFLMKNLTTLDGCFDVVAGNKGVIEGDEEIIASLSGRYKVYQYEDDLFAFVKAQEEKPNENCLQ